jgi:hypothetical protein
MDAHPEHLKLVQDSLCFGVVLAKHMPPMQAMDVLKRICDLLLHPDQYVFSTLFFPPAFFSSIFGLIL